MRRIVGFIVALLFFFGTFSGCSGEETHIDYSVYEKNGSWYMKTALPASVGAAVTAAAQDVNEIPVDWPSYASVEEMRTAIMDGKLEPWMVRWLQQTAPAGEPIPICNMAALYEAVLPERLTCSGVLFAGDRLEFPFTGRDISGKLYIFYDRAEYQHYSRLYSANDGFRLTLTPEVRHETARALFGKMGERERLAALYGMELYYELDTGHGIVYISEPFCDQDANRVRTLEMHGRKDDVYYRVIFQFHGETPTVRWLSQFDIQPVEK